MKKFEYQIHYKISDIDEFLNKMGEKGWELVAVNKSQFYFKREIMSQTRVLINN